MPATQTQLRIIRRFTIAGACAGFVCAAIAIVTTLRKDTAVGAVLVLSLPVYLFLPVGVGALTGCLLGWAVCLVSGKK